MTGAKNGVACPSSLARHEPRDEHRHPDLHEEHPPGAQPAQPTLHLGAQVVEVHAGARSQHEVGASPTGRTLAYTASSWAAHRSQCGA